MSNYNTQLQSNNTDLQTVLQTLQTKATGGDTSVEDGLVTRILTSYTNSRVSNIGNYTFASCTSLTTVSFPKVTTIGYSAFINCTKLTTASFPAATTIGSGAFSKCYNLKSLYLTGSSLCKLSNSNAFSSTPIGGYSTSAGTYGSIYVPASLLASYKAATNWTYFSSRFVGFDGGNIIITFTIEGTKYQAEEGMTWSEWVNSEYNNIGYFCVNELIYNPAGFKVTEAVPSGVIENNTSYTLDIEMGQ